MFHPSALLPVYYQVPGTHYIKTLLFSLITPMQGIHRALSGRPPVTQRQRLEMYHTYDTTRLTNGWCFFLPPFFRSSPWTLLLFHQWLLAMLCYRFAVRISHHTRQPWCRGGRPAGPGGQGASSSAASADGPVDTTTAPGPEVVRHLQRRQRQLLENSLELLAVRMGSDPLAFFCCSFAARHSFPPRGLRERTLAFFFSSPGTKWTEIRWYHVLN